MTQTATTRPMMTSVTMLDGSLSLTTGPGPPVAASLPAGQKRAKAVRWSHSQVVEESWRWTARHPEVDQRRFAGSQKPHSAGRRRGSFLRWLRRMRTGLASSLWVGPGTPALRLIIRELSRSWGRPSDRYSRSLWRFEKEKKTLLDSFPSSVSINADSGRTTLSPSFPGAFISVCLCFSETDTVSSTKEDCQKHFLTHKTCLSLPISLVDSTNTFAWRKTPASIKAWFSKTSNRVEAILICWSSLRSSHRKRFSPVKRLSATLDTFMTIPSTKDSSTDSDCSLYWRRLATDSKMAMEDTRSPPNKLPSFLGLVRSNSLATTASSGAECLACFSSSDMSAVLQSPRSGWLPSHSTGSEVEQNHLASPVEVRGQGWMEFCPEEVQFQWSPRDIVGAQEDLFWLGQSLWGADIDESTSDTEKENTMLKYFSVRKFVKLYNFKKKLIFYSWKNCETI